MNYLRVRSFAENAGQESRRNKWQTTGFYSTQQGVIRAAEGIFAAYVVYIVWSSIAEILERMEELEKRADRNKYEIERMEKSLEELKKQVSEKLSVLERNEQKEVTKWKYLDFGENKMNEAKNDESKDGNSEDILPVHQNGKTRAGANDKILQSEVRFYSHCGKSIEIGVKFCKYCGTKIEP